MLVVLASSSSTNASRRGDSVPRSFARRLSLARARLARAGSWRRVGGTSRCSLARACSLSWGRSRSPRACRGARPSRSASRHHHCSKPRREEALPTTTPRPPRPPPRGAQVPRVQPEPPRDRGAVPTAGATSWTSDWAAPAPRPAPPRVSAGAAAALLTLHLNASPGPPHALRANHRLRARAPAGFAAIVGGRWGARFVYADAMVAAQRDARSLVRLRTQHLGWYVALAAPRPSALRRRRLVRPRRRARPVQRADPARPPRGALMRAMTPDLVLHQVGVAASGTRVMRSARALTRPTRIAPRRNRFHANPEFRRQRRRRGERRRRARGGGAKGGRGRGGWVRARRGGGGAVVSGRRRRPGASYFTFLGANLWRSAVPRAGGGGSRGPSRRPRRGSRIRGGRRVPLGARAAVGRPRGRWGRSFAGEASRAELSELRRVGTRKYRVLYHRR